MIRLVFQVSEGRHIWGIEERPNKALEQTAPRGAARTRTEGVASCSPFGEHRRRSSTRCSTDNEQGMSGVER
jgi:hypothetical protein